MATADPAIDAATAGDPSLVATALNSLDARLARLEKPQQKSLVERIQGRASFFALMVGICLSLISLFDVFWIKPRESLLRDIEEFNRSVNAVASLRQSMIRVQFESPNPQMTFAMNAMVTPQVLANIQYATELLPRLGPHAGIPQLIVLIGEAMNIYDWQNAETLVEKAVATAAAPSLRSEALRYKARLLFLTGRQQQGRQAFEAALNELRTETGFGINGTRAYLVGDWALSEYALGDCVQFSERLRQFFSLAADPQIPAPYRVGLLATLRSQVAPPGGGEGRCPVPAELR
jgi:hypothetical protein